jgi:Carboxypeptidase regulatory-like domain
VRRPWRTPRASMPDGASSRRRRTSVRLRRIGGSLLAVLVGCVALLVLAPVALAATGSISGTVLDAKSKMPLPGVVVTALIPTQPALPGLPNRLDVGGARTDATGEYTITGLAPGSYEVEFSAPERGYAVQYYHAGGNVPTFFEAEPVPVKEGETTPNIGAELREGGTISGTVEGPFGEPLSHAKVLCRAEREPFCPSIETYSDETDSSGRYRIAGLAAGSYTIEFYPPPGLNLVPQAYKEAASVEQATPLKVAEEKEYDGISAVLQEGARITGKVTDAATGQPVAGIFVFPGPHSALGGFVMSESFDFTNASGEYTVDDLRTGSYELTFSYEPQYVLSHPGCCAVGYVLPQTVRGVGAVQGTTTAGINLALIRVEPVNSAPPVVSGAPTVGRTLSCSSGSWTGLQPITFSYAWLRNGSVISGASGSTYVVQPADQGHGLACEITATNEGYAKGRVYHTTATSNVLQVPPPRAIEGVSQSNSRWREGGKLATYSRKTKAPVGTTFSVVLNQPARVSFAFTQAVGGRKVKGKCVAQTRANRRKPGCKRTLTQGTLSFVGHSGVNKVVFQGRISRSKWLPLGAYTLRITALSSIGQRAGPSLLNFTIVK